MLKIYSALCLFVLSFLLFPSETHAQCTNNQSFPAAVSAPTNATVLTISSTQTMTQFTQINGLVAGNRYVLTHSGSNAFVTVRFNTSSGTVVAAGLSPLQFTATCNGNYYVHWNSGTACATSATTGVSTISCVGCGALNSAQCQFSNIFGSATAPTSGSVNFTTCAWGGEYSPLNNVQALTVYRLSSSNFTDFVTVRQGTIGGPVIASGSMPLTFTSTTSGAYFCHWSTNSACGTQNTCRTTTITYVSAGACTACPSAPNPGNSLATYTQVPVGGTTTLSLQSPGSVASTYQWQSAASSSGPWTNITGATSSTYLHTFSTAVWLRCQVTCGSASFSNPVQITLGPCISTSTNGATGGYYGTIKSVAINTLNHTGLAPLASPYYATYPTTTATTTLQGGLSYTLTVNSGFYNAVGAWFDWNANSTFESSEYFSLGSSSSLAYWNGTAIINVPVSVTNGQIAMRIRTEFTAAISPLSSSSSCNTMTYGETRDYKINLLAPVICTGIPNPGVISTNSPTACSTSSLTLSSSQLSVGLGVSYQWQISSTPTGPWTNISGATNTTLSTSISQTSYFQLITTCSNSGSTNESNTIQVSLVSNSCQCLSYPTNSALFTANEEITTVTIGNMTNTSTCSTTALGFGSIANKYSNYSGLIQGPTVDIGSSVNFSLTQASCGALLASNFFQIYIDYNQDGDFLDLNEMVYNQNVSAVGNHTKTGSFIVPLSAQSGITRLRVVNVQGPLAATNYAHTNYNFGETEDYCINLILPPPCSGTPAPGNTLSSVNVVFPGQSAQLSLQNLTTGLGVTYQWQQASTSTGPWSDIANANAPSLTVTPNASMWYQCVVNCSSSSSQSVSAPLYVYYNPYCGPQYTGSSNHNYSITNVSISGTSLNNSSATNVSSPFYQYYNNLPNIELQSGLSYTMQLSAGTSSGQLFAAWIDLNDNNLFEASEKIIQSTSVSNLPSSTFPFTLACDAISGLHRLRVRTIQATVFTILDPCTPYANGETEDYNILITPYIPIQSAFTSSPTSQACTQTTYQYTAASGMQNYSWNISGVAGQDYTILSGGTSTSNMLSIQYLSAGMRVVSLNYNSPNGCLSGGSVTDTVVVQTIQILPLITGPSVLCSSSSQIYSNATVNGLWSVSNGQNAVIDPITGLLTANQGGNVQITYTVPNVGTWCPNSTTTFSLTTLQSPIVTAIPSSTICSGTNVQLNASVNYNTTCSHSISLYDANGDGWSNCSINVMVNGSAVLSNITLNSGSGPATFNFNATTNDVISVTFNAGQWVQEPYFTVSNGAGTTLVSNYFPGISGTWTGIAGGCSPLGAMWTYANANGQGSLINLDVAPIISTAYIATAQGTNGCVASDTTNITVLPSPSVSPINAGNHLCVGSSIIATNGIGGGVWSLNNPNVASINAQTGQILGLFPGNTVIQYTLTAANGCVTQMSSNLIVHALPNAVITSNGSSSICQGNSLTLNAPTAASYLWNTGSTNQSIIVQNSGTYSLTITDNNGCVSPISQSYAVVVNQNPVVNVNLNGPTTFCQGGSLTLTASGGVNYLWNDFTPGSTKNVNSTGSYYVTVSDLNGCSTVSSPINVTVIASPIVNITQNGPLTFCEGSSVSLTSDVNGIWSNGSSLATQSFISSTSIYFTATGSNGCNTISPTYNIVVNPIPVVSQIQGPNTVCQGTAVQFANQTLGGVWSSSNPVISSVSSSGLINGNSVGYSQILYTVTQNGCANTATKNLQTLVAPPSNISVNGSLTFCSGGSVVLSAPLGYGYSWNIPNVTSQSTTITNSGSYSVSVTNSLGCTSNSSPVTVSVVPYPTLAPIQGPSSVCVASSIALSNSVPNGIWQSNNPSIASVSATGVLTAFSPGTILITYITSNSLGCTTSVQKSVNVNPLPIAALSVSGPTTFCTGGSVTLTAPLSDSYSWSVSGALTQSLTVSNSGNYQVTITTQGCSATSSIVPVVVNQLPSPLISSSALSICQGNYTTLSSSPASSYNWSNGSQTSSIQISQAGTYSVTVIDQNGCSATSAPLTISVSPNPIVSISASGPTTFCQGQSVVLSANSNANNYQWNNSLQTSSINVGVSGIYYLTATNAAGCSAVSNEIIVSALPLFTPTITALSPTTVCEGAQVTLVASTGSIYNWSNGSSTQGVNIDTSTTITVTVTNNDGCSGTSAPISVNVLPLPEVMIVSSSPAVFCLGDSTILTASGATTYIWSNNLSGNTQTVYNSGTYVVTGYGANGCQDLAEFVVTVNDIPSNEITSNGNNYLCSGETIHLSAQGGNSYNWIPNNQTSGEIIINEAGSYSCLITGSNGCSVLSESIDIVSSQPTSSTIDVTAVDNFQLNGITYTQSGSYIQNLTNVYGCDSTLQLNLTLTVGLNEQAQLHFSVYPNPNNGTFYITSDLDAINDIYTIEDTQGKLVHSGKILNTETFVELRNVNPGIYFVRITSSAQLFKIIAH